MAMTPSDRNKNLDSMEITKKSGPYEGDGFFEDTQKWDEIESHYNGTIGKPDDPTFTKVTRNQLANGQTIMENKYNLPEYNGVGLSNEQYHNAVGGKSIPMTYGG